MKPKQRPAQEPDGLFKTPLERFIDPVHPLVRLGDEIDWNGLATRTAASFLEAGRPATPARFMIGMMILKAVFDLSDEKLFERWVYDPYFQHFTGEIYFQHVVPHERSGLSHWRGRLGADFLDALIQESLRVAHRTGALTGDHLERVSVDTTVQPKNVKFPTDANLLYTALVKLGACARGGGITLRQSYIRVTKRALIMAQRYAHAKQYKRHKRMVKFLKTRLGRVIRDIKRKTADDAVLRERFAEPLRKARIIKDQALNRRAENKVYSWHAPETECIGKGKPHKPYEFGVKATITTTNARTKAGMFVLHADALHGNPFDGHTLGKVLRKTQDLTGVAPTHVYVDKGYKGHKQNRYTFNPETHAATKPPWSVFMSGRKGLKPRLHKELRRRSAIEPVIGHMKHDHRMQRNFLKGQNGDLFNVKMAAAGYNFARLIRWFSDLLRQILNQMLDLIVVQSLSKQAC